MITKLTAGRYGPVAFNPNDLYVGRSLDLYGEYSRDENELLTSLLSPSCVVVEAGANIGGNTIALAQACDRVFAFEPQRWAFYLLCANIVLAEAQNVFAFHAALGAKAGTVSMPMIDQSSILNYGAVSCATDWTGGEKVKMLALDNFSFPRLDLLKIDVEGMESEVLDGAARTIATHQPYLYIENNSSAGAALAAKVQALGYRTFGHLPPLFSNPNFKNSTTNPFGEIVSINMLAIPSWADPPPLQEFVGESWYPNIAHCDSAPIEASHAS